ncbi:MAG: uracil phosphoribosyltransferase [Verrucomicrobiae bacterium]|nr:uracil phosphoribosyltransferase [Verrucomicrobiae bacterium]NNJ86415.1 uracil phosphoribosyltransferase [Akkermansiaceae bacterium]
MNHHIQHPVIDDRMTRLRQRDCSTSEFRRYVQEIAQLMVPSVTANLHTLPVEVETPLAITTGRKLDREIVLVPILRAGLGMLEGFLRLLPEASVAHIGMARNEDTLQPESYYFNAPPSIQKADVIILDPMLATGGSASATITELKKHGAKHIYFACLVAAPEGLQTLNLNHPDVPVYYPALDQRLNKNGYIVPGLGDAGDRIFGTPPS